MFRRLSNSWELVKASAAVLRSDKELVVFPIVSAIGVLIVTATFAVPLFLAGLFDQMYTDGHGLQPLGMLVAFLFYLVQYFVIFFANTALVGAAMIRLDGGDPTVGDGFRIAMRRAGPILGYALISATVGLILRTIAERAGILGRLVISLIGLAWNLATYLVVPVLAAEDVGLGVHENYVIFQAGDVWLTTRRIDGQFPNYKQLLPETFEAELTIPRQPLLEVVRRAGLMAQRNAPLRLRFTEGELSISAQTQDVGEARESLPVDYAGGELEIGFNPDFLRDGLEAVADDTIQLKLINRLRPGLIAAPDESFWYLIMPIRLAG